MNTPTVTPAPSLVRALDKITELTGRATAWLTLLMVLVTCAVVVLRRFLGVGSIASQESVTYMHAAVFLLGAAYALKHAEQVRVDIFYRRFSVRARAWVDCLGTLIFLLPFCIFVFWVSWPFVVNSWHVHESSTDAGGLAYVYILKTLVPVFAVSLGLQALAEFLRAAATLVKPTAQEGHHVH